MPEDPNFLPDEAERLVGSDRVLAVLIELARHPEGLSLDEASRLLDSAKPTIHRALASLRRAGFATQNSRGQYMLGDEFLRMAFANHEARPETLRVQGLLNDLADHYRETAHYAVLEGRSVVYRAKQDPPDGAVRLTSLIGGRNPAHSTGVGKVLLAHTLPSLDAVRAWAGDVPLESRTANTLTTPEALYDELVLTRERGYGIDDEENEPGINCVAVALFLTSPTVPSGAVSVSALRYRTPLSELVDDMPNLRRLIAQHRTP